MGKRGRATLHPGDCQAVYRDWPRPDLIVSDGAYGIGGFPGDPKTPDKLEDWYSEHISAWSRYAHPATTLWFWNTEIGWATVHPLLTQEGWEYVQTIIWDKGIAHVAGNVNGDTIRRLPTVTEMCVFYRRKLTFPVSSGQVSPGRTVSASQWLRSEWLRAEIPLCRANDVCGVKNAATRKYLSKDSHWYFPPAEAMERLVAHANTHGNPDGRPYFSLDGKRPVTTREWAGLRHPWNHEHGLTNVWSHPPLNGEERYREKGHGSLHLNQKPLEFMRRIVKLASNAGDIVWEPFGGLCTASVAATEAGCHAFAAESNPRFLSVAQKRINRFSDKGRI